MVAQVVTDDRQAGFTAVQEDRALSLEDGSSVFHWSS